MLAESIPSVPGDRDAFTVNEFCARHTFSRETLYSLWRKGQGPAFMKVGGRTIISKEAAAAWRRRGEKEAARHA